jgi:hypothetical protein
MMQIALTGKLAKALDMKPPATDENINPIFTWTANWTRVWENRRTDDMFVLVNNATRFTVAIYEVKRKDLKNLGDKINKAIRRTLLAHNFNTEIVDEYFKLAGNIAYTKNSNRKASSWVTKAGLECAFYVGNKYNGIGKMYSDVVGVTSNYTIVDCPNGKGGYYPYKKMKNAMEDLTELPAYKTWAFEFSIALDLEAYTAERKVLVPADMSFLDFHKVIQNVFAWKDYHLYDFSIYNQKSGKKEFCMVPFEEGLEYDKNAVLMKDYMLSDIFPKNSKMVYTYDFGDDWEHDIELLQVIEEYDGELPYLLEVKGQTPPEDVGGVGGFLEFRKIMMDKDHPEYEETEVWSGNWEPELWEWEKRPKLIDIFW